MNSSEMDSSEKIDWTYFVNNYLCSELEKLKMKDGSFFTFIRKEDCYEIYRTFPNLRDIWKCHVVCISQTNEGSLHVCVGFKNFLVGKDGVLGEKFDEYIEAVLKEVTQ